MTTRRRSLSFLAASAFCWSAARSCGVLVHNEILHRATHLFALPNSTPDLTSLTPLISPLLTSPTHAPSLQAGAFFPDWGYQCLSTDAAAEAAHWPPFLVASVEHIVSKYGYLNDTRSRSVEEQEHLEGLIAFIFAISGHQTSDATWHAIRLPTGFLAALAGIDFEGDVAKAHRVLDFGGDFVLSTRLARMEAWSKRWIGDEWKVPIKDLIAIYERIGKDVNAFVLRYCTMRGLAALRSDLAVGPSLYDSFASQSPMLLNSLDEYHLGGIDEMSVRTVSCWSNLTRWFAHGIDRDEKLRDGWGICDVFQAIKARGGAGDTSDGTVTRTGWSGRREHDLWGEGAMFHRSKREFEMIQIQTDKFGAETYTLPPLLTTDNLLHPVTVPTQSPRSLLSSTKAPQFQPPTYIATYTPYSHFGASLSLGAFSPSGAALAVGAPLESEDSARPSEGNVYILPLSDLLGPSDSPSTSSQPIYLSKNLLTTLHHPATAAAAGTVDGFPDQRFGASSTALSTLNTTLLAISAPGPYTYDAATPPSLPFASSAPAGRIDLFRPGEAARFLALRIKGAELGSIGRRWWGDRMLAADLDGSGREFLIVGGSKSDGSRVCEGREKPQLGEGEVGVFQILPSSSEDYELGKDEGLEIELRLGEKGVRVLGPAGVTVNTWSVSLPANMKADVPCGKTETYEYFGASLGFLRESRTLLVGAPGAAGGMVFAYRLAGGGVELVFTIASPAGRGGLRTGFGGGGLVGGRTKGGREWVIVGAGDEAVDEDVQAGVVRVYVLDSGVGTVVARQVAEVVAKGEGRKYGKFGRKIVGDGNGGVWVGSEFWNGEKGAVWWIDVEGVVDGLEKRGQEVLMGSEGRFEVDVEMMGEEPNARFATSLAVGEGGELFVGIPYSGVAREEQELRFYGAVAVFARK